MSQGRGVIGCCDKSATNYDAEARTCCRDCCTYAGNGNGTQTIYASATKPNDGGNWMQYTTKFQSSGNCSSGGKTYPMKIMPGKVWVKQPPNNPNMVMVAMAHPQCSVMGNPKYMSDGRSRFEEIADQGGNGTGNGGNGGDNDDVVGVVGVVGIVVVAAVGGVGGGVKKAEFSLTELRISV